MNGFPSLLRKNFSISSNLLLQLESSKFLFLSLTFPHSYHLPRSCIIYFLFWHILEVNTPCTQWGFNTHLLKEQIQKLLKIFLFLKKHLFIFIRTKYPWVHCRSYQIHIWRNSFSSIWVQLCNNLCVVVQCKNRKEQGWRESCSILENADNYLIIDFTKKKWNVVLV